MMRNLNLNECATVAGATVLSDSEGKVIASDQLVICEQVKQLARDLFFKIQEDITEFSDKINQEICKDPNGLFV